MRNKQIIFRIFIYKKYKRLIIYYIEVKLKRTAPFIYSFRLLLNSCVILSNSTLSKMFFAWQMQ